MKKEFNIKDQIAAIKKLSPRIKLVMMPEDTNYMGKIFGGAIISQLDLAAAEHC